MYQWDRVNNRVRGVEGKRDREGEGQRVQGRELWRQQGQREIQTCEERERECGEKALSNCCLSSSLCRQSQGRPSFHGTAPLPQALGHCFFVFFSLSLSLSLFCIRAALSICANMEVCSGEFANVSILWAPRAGVSSRFPPQISLLLHQRLSRCPAGPERSQGAATNHAPQLQLHNYSKSLPNQVNSLSLTEGECTQQNRQRAEEREREGERVDYC